MPIINQQQILPITSAIVSIHEQKIAHIDPKTVSEAEILVDYRPVEFSEKHPPKPQLDSDELIALSERKGEKKIGIILSGASDYQILANDLDKVLPILDMIVIDFNGFRDGRGYSLAQALLQHPSFNRQTIMRASGDILPDTLQLLAEVGFIQFDIVDDKFDESWFDWFRSIKTPYSGRSVKQLPMFASV